MEKKQSFIPRVPAVSWGAMVVLWLVFALNSTVRELFNRTSPYMVDEWGVDADAMGVYGTIMQICMGVLPLLFTNWSDKRGQGWMRKYSLIWVAVGYMVLTFLVGISAISSGIIVVVVLLAARNLFAGAGESLECTAIIEWWPKEARGWAAGLHHTGYPWGTLVTGLIISVMLAKSNGDWRLPFLIMPAIAIPIWIIYWLFSRQKTFEKYQNKAVEMGLTPTLDSADGKEEVEISNKEGNLMRCLKNANVLVATIITIVALVMFLGINFWLNPYLAFVAEYDYSKAAAYSLLYTITGGLGQIVWGRISDFIGRKNSLMFCFAWLAVWVLILPQVKAGLGALVGIQLCIGFCVNALFALIYAMVQDSAPKGAIGTAMGLNVTASIAGAATPAILGGLIAAGGGWSSASGYQAGVIFMCVCMVIGFLLVLLFSHETVGKRRGKDWALVSYKRAGIED
ncbi:MAG: MFS transporter [Clostridiales Family XIII bacterium]|jgi:sugar phosphate permease|nr:MFS transporter [Clostridiales Family XIII bacterium]